MESRGSMEKIENRTRDIQKKIWVNSSELVKIKQRMEQVNIENFGTFARYMMLTGKVITVDFKELVELRKEVNRIGVNINQLAKYINTSEEVAAEEYRSLQEQIQSVKDLVADKFTSESSLLEELMEKQEGGRN